jgi:hypothetical protein
MKPFLTFLTLLVMAALSGCKGPYITTGDSGVPGPDGDIRVILSGHGEHGKEYAEQTKKLLDVSIVRGVLPNRKTLYSHRYDFIGSDLCGHVEWDTTNRVAVYVYDYGIGVLAKDAQKRGTASNQIATLSFEWNAMRKEYVEKK